MLEDGVGVDLFDRRRGKVLLTPEGERFAAAVREALQLISTAAEQIRNRTSSNDLVISALPSMAQCWLVPRLPRLRKLLPGVRINVHTGYDHINFLRDRIDVVLKFGLNNYPGGDGQFLMSEAMFPVCAASLVASGAAPTVPADLRGHTLLETFDPRWGDWLTLAALPGLDSQAQIRLRDPSMVLQAAAEGQGIAMARKVLAHDDIASGKLVRLFDLELTHPHAYWIVTPKGTRDDARMRIFRQWLHAEAAAMA